ncbi:speckle-type POZ protein-like B [Parasteatoda tepidariorum]|uniref:speckle-type POZ protein-like B n=1 Tax=Parasteatoda tepidariorum TaxID=114398 RepID=UPI0039BC7BFF
MLSGKIPIDFVTPTFCDPRHEQCIKKDIGYIMDNFWCLKIAKSPNKESYAPFLFFERDKHHPNVRIRFQLQFINLDTKEVCSTEGKRVCKKEVNFKLKTQKMFSGKCTLCVKGELEVHLLQFSQIQPAPQFQNLPVPQALNTLSHDFKNLFCNQKFSDLVIECGPEEFPAHKNILIARSSLFSEILLKNPQKARLNISNMDPTVFRDVLLYIYSGKTPHFTFQSACDLLGAATKYGMKDLETICVDFINRSFTLENVFGLFCKHEMAQCYASDFIVKNIEFIENSEQWKIFKQEKPDIATNFLNLKKEQINDVFPVLSEIK